MEISSQLLLYLVLNFEIYHLLETMKKTNYIKINVKNVTHQYIQSTVIHPSLCYRSSDKLIPELKVQ